MPEGQGRGVEDFDSGLACLALISRYFQRPLDSNQVRHDYGKVVGAFDAVDIVRCAKRAGLLARLSQSRWDRLDRAPLPAIAPLKDGRFVLFARKVEGKMLIQDPAKPGPELLSAEEVAALWDGRLILVTHREALAGPARGFDLS